MILNVEKYLPYLDELDLSPAQKIEMMTSVWCLMESQVDKAFELHQVQLAQKEKAKTILQSRTESLDSNPSHISRSFDLAMREAANEECVKEKES